MGELFDAVVLGERQNGRFPEVRVCVRCDLSGETVLCPVSPACSSIEDFETEARRLHEDLDRALDRGRRALTGCEEPCTPGSPDDMSAEELWHVLEAISDDALFVERFNQLDESYRRDVAEYVLTSCSVFSGRPAMFSSSYDAATALLDE